MLPSIKNALGIAGIVAVLSVAGAFDYLCYSIVRATAGVPALTDAYTAAAPKPGAIDSAIAHVDAALPAPGKLTQLVSSANSLVAITASGVQATAKDINRPCGPAGCGTLAQINKTLVKVGDELVTTQLEQRKVFPHVTQAMDNLGDSAAGITQASNAVTTLADNQHLAQILTHADGMSDSMDKMLADGYTKEHQLFFPTKKKLGFWGAIYSGAVTVDHFIPPLF
jgi:hypothetical protein